MLIAPFAPHIAEELWEQTGGKGSVCDTEWPTWNEDYLVEDEVQMPVSFNGKARFQINLPATASKEAIIEAAMSDERSQKSPGGQAGRQDHRRTGTHHQYRGKIDRPKTISITGVGS